jgi:hypothetical protein
MRIFDLVSAFNALQQESKQQKQSPVAPQTGGHYQAYSQTPSMNAPLYSQNSEKQGQYMNNDFNIIKINQHDSKNSLENSSFLEKRNSSNSNHQRGYQHNVRYEQKKNRHYQKNHNQHLYQ